MVMKRTANIAEAVSKASGKTVLWPRQIRILAYILGYKGKNNELIDSDEYGREVEPNIPEKEKVFFNEHAVKLQGHGYETSLKNSIYGDYGFTINGIEEAFKLLSEKGKLYYTPERFKQAVKSV